MRHVCILKKSENATLLLMVKMDEKRFLIEFLFCKIKCPMSSSTCAVHVFRALKPKNEIFMCDFILSLKNEIRGIFDLEYRDNSGIVPDKVGILTLSGEVGIPTCHGSIPELSLRKVRIRTK